MRQRVDLRPARARLAGDLLGEVEDEALAQVADLVAGDDGDRDRATRRSAALAHLAEVDADALEVVGEAVVAGDVELVDRGDRDGLHRRRELRESEDALGPAVDVDDALLEAVAAALPSFAVLAFGLRRDGREGGEDDRTARGREGGGAEVVEWLAATPKTRASAPQRRLPAPRVLGRIGAA